MSDKTASTELADLFSKHLAEPIKEKLKTLIAQFKTEATVEVKAEEAPAATETYNEATLTDGTILKYTGDLAVGSKCLIVTPAGEVPAPEGEHKLMDGSTIVIKKEGEDSVISEIKPAEEMKDQAILAMITKAVDDATKEKFSAIEKENKTLKAKLEATELKLSKKSSQLSDLGIVVEAMASIGTGEPINKQTIKSHRLSPPIEKASL